MLQGDKVRMLPECKFFNKGKDGYLRNRGEVVKSIGEQVICTFSR